MEIVNQAEPEGEFITKEEECIPVLDDVDQQEITKDKVRKAVKKIKNNRAQQQAEMLKN